MNLNLIAVAAALFLFPFGHAAVAQDLNNWCRQKAQSMCEDPGMSLAACMENYDLWPAVPNECVGDLQTMIEMEREFQQQRQTDRITGYSYGGVLRSGPGTQYSRLAGLLESDWLEVLEDTGIWFDGYRWFRVNTSVGAGYHWGGIFCVAGSGSLDGVFSRC